MTASLWTKAYMEAAEIGPSQVGKFNLNLHLYGGSALSYQPWTGSLSDDVSGQMQLDPKPRKCGRHRTHGSREDLRGLCTGTQSLSSWLFGAVHPIARLLEEFALARAEGRYLKLLHRLARLDLLVLDDWAMKQINTAQQEDLYELLDDRMQTRSAITAS